MLIIASCYHRTLSLDVCNKQRIVLLCSTTNIIWLPFSYALNCALMKQFSIRYLVTKDGGAVGGFAEKAQAAQDTGAQLIVVRRPAENGQTAAQILARCKEVLV